MIPWAHKLKLSFEQLIILIAMLINTVHNTKATFLQVMCTT